MRAQVTASCASLAPGKVDLLYLHAPDAETTIEETLCELAELHKEGKFSRLGLSNFPAWEVVGPDRLCSPRHPPRTSSAVYRCSP